MMELGCTTAMLWKRESDFATSWLMPSAKYLSSASPFAVVNGRTATESRRCPEGDAGARCSAAGPGAVLPTPQSGLVINSFCREPS